MPEFPVQDRRIKKDRRRNPTSPLSSHSLFGSRKKIRRKEDRKVHFYVDRYSFRSILAVNAALILSVADAIFTLRLVSVGAKELNPVMSFFLQFGSIPFLLTKYLLTGSCLIWFLIHKNFYLFRSQISVKSILISVPILYTILIIYELVLIL